MNDVIQIIDALGGNAVVAAELGLTPSAISEMKRRGRIPGRYWLALTRLANGKGISDITLDRLAAITSEGAAA